MLLDESEPATEEVIAFHFDSTWDRLVSSTPLFRVQLPVQHSATHRIAIVGANGRGRSVVERKSVIVTGLLADTVFQIIPDSTSV